jgi:hypothetical protein
MDQDTGAGHHAVTHLAVHDLYRSGQADTSGLINGQTERQFFDQLDHWQHYQDRFIDARTIAGPTTHPGWLDGHAQREHSMADPHLSGTANLNIDRDYVVDELDQAHAAHLAANNVEEMKHLGAAAHALEDSYSDAHMWRDESVYSGDPEAPVKSINVFDPGGLSTHAGLISEGTHDPRFDHVPVDKSGNPILPNHQAASKAVAEMLQTYFDKRDQDAHTAHADCWATVDRFFQPDQDGVHVNSRATPEWTHERDHRLDEAHKLEQDFHDHEPQPVQPTGPAQPENRSPNDGGAPPGGAPPTSQTDREQSQANSQQSTDPQLVAQTNTTQLPDGHAQADQTTFSYNSQALPGDDQATSASNLRSHPQDDQATFAYNSQSHPQDDQATLAHNLQSHPQDDQANTAYNSQSHPQDDQATLDYASQAHPQDDQTSTATTHQQDNQANTATTTADTHSNVTDSVNNASVQQHHDSTGANTGATDIT